MNELGLLLRRLLQQRKDHGIRAPYAITTEDGRNLTASMISLRFDGARKLATEQALASQDKLLVEQIRLFQLRDIRPKAASEILDLAHASRLLGHSDKRITETGYRRVGEVVKPTHSWIIHLHKSR